MNKKNTILLLLLLTVLLVSCGNKTAEHYGVDAKTVAFESLEEMEDFSGVIIRVVREEEQQPVITTNKGAMVSGYTLSQVKVTEIYKDETDTVGIGNTITILENEVFDSEDNIYYHIAGYNMMEEGKEYLLFLKANTFQNGEVYYVAAGVNYGTISLETDNRMALRLNRTSAKVCDFSEMQPIWDAALQKYTVDEK